jgi:ABC-type glycerol-3-phosphate transport system substrate-binding protein
VTPPPPIGLITLSLWLPDSLDPYDEKAGISALGTELNGFMQDYPDVQVRVMIKKAKGQGGVYDLLSTSAVAAPSILPDVVILSAADLKIAADAQIIQPIKQRDLLDDADFFPFALEGVLSEDEVYGIPFVMQAQQTVYRTWVSPMVPISWTAVLTEGYTMLFPAAPPNDLADDALLMSYLGTGGAVLDADGNLALDRARLEELYTFFSLALERGLLNSELALSMPDALACWEQYQAGVAHLSPVPMGVYWTSEALPDSSPGWMPTPQGDLLTIGHFWAFAVVTEDPIRQEAVLQLIRWLVDPGVVSGFSRTMGLLPARRRALELWPLSETEITFLSQLLEYAEPPFSPVVDSKVRQALQAGLAALLNGEVETPEDAATRALTILRR